MSFASHTTRRAILVGTAAGLAVLAWGPFAAAAESGTSTVADEIRKVFGDRPLNDGKVKLDLPTIAENGLVVPLSFEVESPMTADDHVKAVHVFAEGNPSPLVAAYTFTPLAPKAAASLRIRLAKTQHVVAVAEMSDGTLYTSRREVKVTIGGCGG
jgi:sulfur-oxidizing protein SoxY